MKRFRDPLFSQTGEENSVNCVTELRNPSTPVSLCVLLG